MTEEVQKIYYRDVEATWSNGAVLVGMVRALATVVAYGLAFRGFAALINVLPDRMMIALLVGLVAHGLGLLGLYELAEDLLRLRSYKRKRAPAQSEPTTQGAE